MNKRFALRIFAAGLMVSAWVSGPQTVQAQGSSLFGGSGITKSGTGGITGSLTGSGFGSSGATARGGSTGGAQGSSGFGGGFGNALGGQGASPFGGGMSGMSGLGGAGATGFGNTSGLGNNSGMVGRSNTGFAGNAQAGQAGGNAGGAIRNFRNGGNFNGQRGNNNFNQNATPERTTSAIRPRQRVAFDYNVKSPEVVATRVTMRMDKIGLKNPALKGVAVRVEGDQLVLTGKVKNAEQSRLAANLLRLEPGVKSIRNDLEVEQTSTE